MELKTTYFDNTSKENTAEVLRIATQRGKELGIKKIIVASTTGAVGLAAVEGIKGFEIIVVTHVTGMLEPGVQEMPDDMRRKLESMGARVITTTHAFGGLSMAMRKKFNTYVIGDIIANSLRVFGQGMKVVIETVLMAADCGVVRTDEQVISIAGSNEGADTAIVCKPVNAQRFFDLKVQEIICKPYFK